MTESDSNPDHEIWYAPPEFPGVEFSSELRARNATSRKIITLTASRGYIRVPLCAGGKRQYLALHRIVASYIYGPIPSGLLVLHRDDVKTTNYPSNLSFGDHALNGRDRVRNGRIPKGEAHFERVITRELSAKIFELRRTGFSYGKIGMMLGVSKWVVDTALKAEGNNDFGHSREGLPHHGGRILTEKLVVEIHRLRAAGATQVKISESLGVSQYAVCDVLRGKTWTHVKLPT